MRTTPLRCLAVGVATALLLVGCAGTDERATPTGARSSGGARPTTESQHVPSSAPARHRAALSVSMSGVTLSDAQDQVARVVLEYWRRYGRAVSRRDLDGSRLAEVVTGPTGLATTAKVVENLRSNGQRYQGSLTLDVRRVELGQDSATVNTCIDQSHAQLADTDGRPVNEPGKQRVMPIAHTLVRRGDTWLVDTLARGGYPC
ncbi:MAG: hypothetical protein WCA46_20725 [Actinocatenispora sp.]